MQCKQVQVEMFAKPLIFALFAVNLYGTKLYTHEYILYMCVPMEQPSKTANKKQANFFKLVNRENYHFYSIVW